MLNTLFEMGFLWFFLFIGVLTVGLLWHDHHYWENVKKPQYTEEQLLENIKRSKLVIRSLQNKSGVTREELDYRLDVLDFWEHEYERTKKYNERYGK